MAQHIWLKLSHFRACEVCLTHQTFSHGEWLPAATVICPGDTDDDGRRITWRRPTGPSGVHRVLEEAL